MKYFADLITLDSVSFRFKFNVAKREFAHCYDVVSKVFLAA